MKDLSEFLAKQSEQNTVTFERIKQPLIVNPFTLSDLAWKDSTFTSEEIQKAFKTFNMKILGRIFYRILSSESKKLLASIRIIDVNEQGQDFELTFENVYEKLPHLISGEKEIAMMLLAIMKSRNVSMPENKQVEGQDEKKSLDGAKSLTSSPQNTDIAQTNLES